MLIFQDTNNEDEKVWVDVMYKQRAYRGLWIKS